MARQLRSLVMLAMLATCASGCCCFDCCTAKAPWPCGRTWYGSMCGERFWHEWFSHKPPCADPCSCCGQHFDCTDNPYVEGGLAGPMHPEAGYAMHDEHGGQMIEPAPPEEVPAIPAAASTFINEFGQEVAYEPVRQLPPRHFEPPHGPRPASYVEPPRGKPYR